MEKREDRALAPESAAHNPKPEPPAPVNGGMRWRTYRHDFLERCRRDKGLFTHDPDAPNKIQPSEPEPGAVYAPHITTTPPTEARLGEEYVYPARAYDGATNGYTWYFEKSAPGMRVDRYTGVVTWIPEEGGYVEVALCARSVYGAASRQSWTLCVRKAAAARNPAANRRFSEGLRRKILRGSRALPVFRRYSRREDDADHPATAPPWWPVGVAYPLRL